MVHRPKTTRLPLSEASVRCLNSSALCTDAPGFYREWEKSQIGLVNLRPQMHLQKVKGVNAPTLLLAHYFDPTVELAHPKHTCVVDCVHHIV